MGRVFTEKQREVIQSLLKEPRSISAFSMLVRLQPDEYAELLLLEKKGLIKIYQHNYSPAHGGWVSYGTTLLRDLLEEEKQDLALEVL